jgi:hypothetical protein
VRPSSELPGDQLGVGGVESWVWREDTKSDRREIRRDTTYILQRQHRVGRMKEENQHAPIDKVLHSWSITRQRTVVYNQKKSVCMATRGLRMPSCDGSFRLTDVPGAKEVFWLL